MEKLNKKEKGEDKHNDHDAIFELIEIFMKLLFRFAFDSLALQLFVAFQVICFDYMVNY